MQLTSTNIKLFISSKDSKEIIVISEEHIEELRNLLNDYLEMQKKYETNKTND